MSSTESTRSDEAAATPNFDPYEYLGIVPNPDGSITRLQSIPDTPATSDPNNPSPVLTKDIPLNQSNNTWFRIFLHRQALDSPSSTKLPLLVYYHGGGFVVGSAATTFHHDFCVKIAGDIPAIVVSVEYRLAPEHRLPAAYDDSVEALHHIKTTPDEWLGLADLSKCFLMGTSAGGNIAYHVGLRAAEVAVDLEPLKIRGLILHQPFFGGAKRTPSELRLAYDKVLPLSAIDLMWELSLPVGVDRDHEYCNPTVGGGSRLFVTMGAVGWKVLVTGCDGDPLIDRQMELVRLLEERGVQVAVQFSEGGYHAFELFEPSPANKFCAVLKDFLLSFA